MPPITSEAEWHACDYPWDLGRYVVGRIGPQRFRWLTVGWGSLIRDFLTEEDRLWFDAFDAWVNKSGPDPSTIYLPNSLGFLGYSADIFMDALKAGSYHRASVEAASVFSRYSPRHSPLEPSDLPFPHSVKAKHKRAANAAIVDAHRADRWEKSRQHERDVCNAFCDQFREVAGNPFRPVQIRPEWLSSTVVDLAHCIHLDRAFSAMPLLSDALLDAGCDHPQILAHCRGPGPHVRGCWVLSLLMGE
jgi:hypothetical protein